MAISVSTLERYEAGHSLLHRADARVKLPVTVAYIFAVTLTPVGHWPALALMAAPLPLAVALGGLSPLLVLRRSALALPFVLAAVPLMFTKEGETLFTLPLFGWDATRQGLEAVITILAKSWLSVTAAVVLTATTSSVDLVRALRSLALPRILVATVSFMYRYVFVIAEEALRLMRGRDSRSACVEGRKSGGTTWWRAGILGNMVGSLFLRSYERSERVYAAMQARGYDGEPRFLWNPPWRAAEITLGVLVALYAIGIQVYVRY
jgi:cobalt/nickel transport system permease protein